MLKPEESVVKTEKPVTEKENAYEYRYREQKRGRKRDRAGT